MNNKPLVVQTYAPESPIKHPGAFLLEVIEGFKTSRELAWRLTLRDFSSLYRQSIAGYLWAFLPPLVTSFTFVTLRSSGAFTIEGTSIPYAAFALTGTILWQTFVDSMNNPLKTMGSCKAMLVKINFPREALILSPIFMSLINLGIRLAILIPVMLWFQFPLTPSLLLAPLGLLSLIILGTCFGLLLAPLGALYSDIGLGIMLSTTFWMFLTPVVFPGIRTGVAGILMQINPVTYTLGATRDWLTGTPDSPFTMGFLIVTGGSLITLGFGAVIFRLLLGRVVERMGM